MLAVVLLLLLVFVFDADDEEVVQLLFIMGDLLDATGPLLLSPLAAPPLPAAAAAASDTDSSGECSSADEWFVAAGDCAAPQFALLDWWDAPAAAAAPALVLVVGICEAVVVDARFSSSMASGTAHKCHYSLNAALLVLLWGQKPIFTIPRPRSIHKPTQISRVVHGRRALRFTYAKASVTSLARGHGHREALFGGYEAIFNNPISYIFPLAHTQFFLRFLLASPPILRHSRTTVGQTATKTRKVDLYENAIVHLGRRKYPRKLPSADALSHSHYAIALSTALD